MKLEINDVIYWRFVSEFRGTVKVKDTIVDVYPAIYNSNAIMEVSLRYEDLGDVITEHGIDMDSPKISLD